MEAQIALTVSQQFEIERFSRAIDANADAEQLRSIAKQLLQAWHTQKAATNWVIQQQLSQPLAPVVPPQS
ncbi:MAG: hypothetical protein FJ054_08825 [Cyanobacteria bacterium M_surface_10_m2_119]|nr:hypothetical protein [Cyanobacteria bacterium M_surface_10_m2_119]